MDNLCGEPIPLRATDELEPTVKESGPLTPHKEERDPLMLSMSSSAGLIAWSKNLQPDELSPQASLASFFPAS
eukprot:s2649_g6.t2